MGQNKKIGIMGGTFNPIHTGHLILAEAAYELYHLDKVLIMPTKNQYYKDNSELAANGERLDMIELAIASNPHFELSTLEYQRNGTTYTVDTLEALNKTNPECEYYFIMGADSLGYMETWKDYSRILKLSTILVASRNDAGTQSVLKLSKKFQHQYSYARIYHLDSPSIEISSKEIRARIKQNRTIKYLVPESVENYIKKKKLYNS